MSYGLVLDVYEGSLECDEAEFKKGGVIGIIIRLNDMNGGHHKDTNFDTQWTEAKSFYPVPYFVYNPWVTGQENYQWLFDNMPTCPAVFIDTEVRKPELSPEQYGIEYNIFISLCKKKWKTIIYTGAGFIDALTPWPSDVDYWWAAYPLSLYPVVRTNVSWENLHALTNALSWPPTNSSTSPGTIKLWQCSGDRLIVPGTIRAMDISIFPGTAIDYCKWIGYNEFSDAEKNMTETLQVPFVSQIEVGATEHNNDCGAAAALMVLKAYNIGELTVDQVYNQIAPVGDNSLLISGLQTFLVNKGIKNERKTTSLFDLFTILSGNRPVIALLHYGALVDAKLTEKTGFRAGHFVVVIGMDIRYVYIHDPYSNIKGNCLAVPIAVFLSAWGQCVLDNNPNNVCIAMVSPIKDLSVPIPPPVPPVLTGIKYEFGVNPVNGVPVIAVNVRSGPSQSYSIVKILYKATTPFIYITQVSGEYAQLADKSGWIYIAYFKRV
jgi:hypothetical protein